MEDHQVALVAARAQLALEVAHVPPHQRLHTALAIVVENRSCSNISGSTSLEVVISAVELLLEDLAHALLVGRVGVGIDEADRHRLDPVPLDQLRHLAGAVLVELLEDRAGVVDALGDLEAEAPGNRRRIDVR